MIRRTIAVALACACALAFSPRHAAATRLNVDVWLDRGDAAVYQPGEALGIRARVSEDAYLLVYEIDSQGYVNLLYPIAGRNGYADGKHDLDIPPQDAQLDLVAEEPTGEGYVVAIASSQPFQDLPWYLRPYDAHAQGVGYQGDTPPEEQGVTADGQIVGDPFVAMERIRRRVLSDPDDETRFATSYTTYYVHERVKYPRYLCDDCHRPSYWTWWPGYDPYFATCSAFDFRANWGWYWGPSYWTGFVPYYVFVPRPDCAPWVNPRPGITYSSWLGWNKWTALWGGRLKHKETAAPQGYVAPDRYRDGRVAGVQGRFDPPGYVTAANTPPMLRGGRGLPYGRFRDAGRQGGMLDSHGGETPRPVAPTRGGNPERPDIGASRGGERPFERPAWNGPQGGRGRGALEMPRRYERQQAPRMPQRFEAPQAPRMPQRFETPQAPRMPQREYRPAPREQRPSDSRGGAPRVAAPSRPSSTPARGDGDHKGDRGDGHHGR